MNKSFFMQLSKKMPWGKTFLFHVIHLMLKFDKDRFIDKKNSRRIVGPLNTAGAHGTRRLRCYVQLYHYIETYFLLDYMSKFPINDACSFYYESLYTRSLHTWTVLGCLHQHYVLVALQKSCVVLMFNVRLSFLLIRLGCL